jgi:acetyl esterase/lipase
VISKVKMSYDIEVEDIEYIRHGATPLLARLYWPQGPGPFPMMVELRWRWCRDRPPTRCSRTTRSSGVVVARLPATAAYPASLQDIHYAIRWLKPRAKEERPDMIGSMGNSSGAHQAMLLGPFERATAR